MLRALPVGTFRAFESASFSEFIKRNFSSLTKFGSSVL
jgi:hypothetical protein